MATWNPENILITQKGREVLSKVQAGIGSIQVSRIVSGGGYVSPSQLYRQTTVSYPKQELDIVSKNTDENGSEIVCTGNNSELEEAYSLYQLGIYVTHQDYTGEVLYLIAQCDTSDPDYIPLPSETPVTLQYSLYMEHSGVSSISITINPSGQLTAGMLDQPGGVPSLTDDGTLEEEVIPESIARQDELESKPSYYYVDNGTDISEVIEERVKFLFGVSLLLRKDLPLIPVSTLCTPVSMKMVSLQVPCLYRHLTLLLILVTLIQVLILLFPVPAGI